MNEVLKPGVNWCHELNGAIFASLDTRECTGSPERRIFAISTCTCEKEIQHTYDLRTLSSTHRRRSRRRRGSRKSWRKSRASQNFQRRARPVLARQLSSLSLTFTMSTSTAPKERARSLSAASLGDRLSKFTKTPVAALHDIECARSPSLVSRRS